MDKFKINTQIFHKIWVNNKHQINLESAQKWWTHWKLSTSWQIGPGRFSSLRALLSLLT